MTDLGPPQATVRFILASASPARYDTLLRAGVVPERLVSNFDESSVPDRPPAELAQAIANSKATVVWQELKRESMILDEPLTETLVLGCDSLFELDGEALGKPSSYEDSIARWKKMRGRKGILHTGHCLIDCVAERTVQATVSTTVHFSDVTDEEIEVYCSSGEPSNVAGAFTIDGFGGWFIDGVEGDHHNVVGLSLPVLRTMLKDLNVSLWDLGYPTP
ncbi:MAG: nucleoside triphosphate pyrophosphatase [Pseudonocardiales bacterium]|nr:Maf family nucleotide pyrophosphatase [Actinomycetota bacterium]